MKSAFTCFFLQPPLEALSRKKQATDTNNFMLAFSFTQQRLCRLKAQMPHSLAAIDQLFQRINSDFQMPLHIIRGYLLVAFLRFHSLGYHGLITYQQQCPGWNFIIEAHGKNGCRFHVDGISPYVLEVFFEFIIMLPNTTVSSIYGSCPVIDSVITNSGGHSFLQSKGRQCRHFFWEIVVRSTFPAYRCDRQYEITQLVSFFSAATFTQGQYGLGLNG